jgi:hypothetical protein
MDSRAARVVFVALALFVLSRPSGVAQGGWDVWTVRLRDGTQVEAAPVWSLDPNELRYSFEKGGAGVGVALARSRIRSMSNNLGNSELRGKKGADYAVPPLPEGDSDQDVVVFDDGRQVTGPVTIRPGKDASGNPKIYGPVLVQNGVETDLTRVAHVKFASLGAGSKAAPPQ